MINKCKSESGFSMVESILALAIVSIAIVGLFISTVFSRSRAIQNYHYRSALLIGAGVADSLKFVYKVYGEDVYNFPPEVNKKFSIDDRDGNPLYVTVKTPSRAPIKKELSAGIDVLFKEVNITCSWEEPGAKETKSTKDKKSIILREDYFYREVIQ